MSFFEIFHFFDQKMLLLQKMAFILKKEIGGFRPRSLEKRYDHWRLLGIRVRKKKKIEHSQICINFRFYSPRVFMNFSQIFLYMSLSEKPPMLIMLLSKDSGSDLGYQQLVKPAKCISGQVLIRVFFDTQVT